MKKIELVLIFFWIKYDFCYIFLTLLVIEINTFIFNCLFLILFMVVFTMLLLLQLVNQCVFSFLDSCDR